MKKLLVLFASGLLTLTALAQKSSLVGSWVMLDSKGFPTTSVKTFMPDGKLLGQSFNSDFTVSSVWFMSNYKMLNDTSFVDHAFYHSDINYQRDFFFTFHMENDSVLATSYIDYRGNNARVDVRERWKKMDRPVPVFSDAEWEALHQKSLVEFDRLPKEGQTTEQYAQELYDKAQDYIKRSKLDYAFESLLVRAELDTTNIQWQDNAITFLLEQKAAPSVAEKLADRYISLSEAVAPVANDTSVIKAYRLKAYLLNYRGNPSVSQVRELAAKCIEMEKAAGNKPTKDYALDYFLMAMTYLPEGEFDVIQDYALKSIDIMEKASDVSEQQKGEAYFLLAMSQMQTGHLQEAIDILTNKVQKQFVDEQGQPMPRVYGDVWPLIVENYEDLLLKNPKDKKVLKAYREFLADKMICAKFEATNRELNVWGEHYVMERDSWTVENPIVVASHAKHYLLLKDGEFTDVNFKSEDDRLGATFLVVPCDAAKKQELIRQWKEYRKNKKAIK